MSLQSGLAVITQSGIPVVIQSGAPVTLQSGQYVIMSGQGVEIRPSGGVRARAILLLSDVSGGVALVSGIVHSVTMKALSGAVYIGGATDVDMPYAGYGLLLGAGEAVTLDVGNFNLVKACAVVSGNPISYIGIV